MSYRILNNKLKNKKSLLLFNDGVLFPIDNTKMRAQAS